MKRFLVILFILLIFITGCSLDSYRNENDAVSAVEAWFNYTNGEDDLGLTRRQIESIQKIISTNCEYVENDKNKNYIYKCNMEYQPIGETVIPLSSNEKKSFYVAISYNDDRTYNYIVYNSSYTDKPWLNDNELNYGKDDN